MTGRPPSGAPSSEPPAAASSEQPAIASSGPSRPPEAHELEVAPEHRGERLDAWLAGALPSLSRARLRALIEEGRVRVDGGKMKAGGRVRGGETVTVEVPAPVSVELVPEEIAFGVLFEDEHLAVIDKPAGLVVHPGAGHSEGTLVHGLLHRFGEGQWSLQGIGGELRPGIVHRLDKETSGCMVVAKHDAALTGLQALFKAREVEKRYLALVHGQPPDSGRVESLFGRHPVHRQRYSGKVRDGKQAVSDFEVLERFSDELEPPDRSDGRSRDRSGSAPNRAADGRVRTQAGGAALVEVLPRTGRTHQIRVHLTELGHPLFADALYGTGRRGSARMRQIEQQLGRCALHAAKLSFVHPMTDAQLSFEAPLPPDLEGALAELRGAGA